jgi:hypothetical protein
VAFSATPQGGFLARTLHVDVAAHTT